MPEAKVPGSDIVASPGPLGGAVVGDQERIDVDLAQSLVIRLRVAAVELHASVALPLTEAARGHIETTIAELDALVKVIQRAAFGLGSSD